MEEQSLEPQKKESQTKNLGGGVASQLQHSFRELEKNFLAVSSAVGINETEFPARLKKLETEIAQSKSLVATGEIVGMVTHALRNHLGGIIGFADMLDKDIPETNRGKKYIQKINDGLQDMLKTVNNLLDYSRPEKLDIQSVEVDKFLEQVLSHFEIELKHAQKKISLQKQAHKPGLTARFDPEKMQHVLLNLLQNAAQAIEDSGKIELVLDSASHKGENCIYIKVADNGTGISSEGLKKIFTPFYTSKAGGTGLGLAAVKKIVEAHRGEVQIKSEMKKGTIVEVWIPRE